MQLDRDQLKQTLARLAAEGLYVGTSSWKYPGWRGQLYDEARYVYRGRWSEARFERNCLAEYAEVFKTVSVDAAYYQFPTESYLKGLADQVPGDFRFGLKITDDITIKRFPNLPRFGRRAGQVNPHFLDAELFERAFLKPCETIREQVGVLMFEFTRFHSDDFARGREFVEALEAFLARLPRGWPYAVEIRNATFLQPEYFETLRRHDVAHVFNSWDAMPPVAEQIATDGSFTASEMVAARFLLRPGRRYEQAVKLFSPYSEMKDAYAEGRVAAAHILQQSREKKRKAFVYVNNRLEGNALETILAILALANV